MFGRHGEVFAEFKERLCNEWVSQIRFVLGASTTYICKLTSTTVVYAYSFRMHEYVYNLRKKISSLQGDYFDSKMTVEDYHRLINIQKVCFA